MQQLGANAVTRDVRHVANLGVVGSLQPERSAKRSGVAEREARAGKPLVKIDDGAGTDWSLQPERSAKRSGVAEREARAGEPLVKIDDGAGTE